MVRSRECSTRPDRSSCAWATCFRSLFVSSKGRIKAYLLGVAPDEYPLRDYFPGASTAQKKTGEAQCPLSRRENIKFMETDDDIRYTVLGQLVLRDKGRDFTTEDVMKAWIDKNGGDSKTVKFVEIPNSASADAVVVTMGRLRTRLDPRARGQRGAYLIQFLGPAAC